MLFKLIIGGAPAFPSLAVFELALAVDLRNVSVHHFGV